MHHTATMHPCLILIADDDTCLLETLTEFLLQNGYDVIKAQDGHSALEQFIQKTPDLILLDINMPSMDGCLTCHTIRSRPGGDRVTIIMMTGLSDDASVDQAFAAGADDYVTKPIHWAVLRQRIRLFIDRRKAEETIRHQATFDSLTDLPNRTLFMDRLERAMALARRNQKQLAVIFIDLDQFKKVNDTLGHAYGDELLRLAARRMQQCIRHSDTIARFGGDEFTLILSNFTLLHDIELLARKILTALLQPFNLMGYQVTISASIGISLFPTDGDTLDCLLRNADHAMYSIKKSGKNGFAFFHNMTVNPTQSTLTGRS